MHTYIHTYIHKYKHTHPYRMHTEYICTPTDISTYLAIEVVSGSLVEGLSTLKK